MKLLVNFEIDLDSDDFHDCESQVIKELESCELFSKTLDNIYVEDIE